MMKKKMKMKVVMMKKKKKKNKKMKHKMNQNQKSVLHLIVFQLIIVLMKALLKKDLTNAIPNVTAVELELAHFMDGVNMPAMKMMKKSEIILELLTVV